MRKCRKPLKVKRHSEAIKRRADKRNKQMDYVHKELNRRKYGDNKHRKILKGEKVYV